MIMVIKITVTMKEPLLADIYAIKLLYKLKLINVRTHNVKHYLQYLV